MAYDVKSFGAKGDGVTDDSPAFRAALAAAVAAGGGVIEVPPLRNPNAFYALGKDPDKPGSINIENITVPITFKGESGSRLAFQGVGNFGEWSMFRIRASQNLKFIGLHLEMGVVTQQDPNTGSDPHHLIHLDNRGGPIPARNIENVEITGCTFRWTRGDQVRMWSEQTRLCKSVWVHHNYFDGSPTATFYAANGGATAGVRSCVQVQRNCSQIWVTHNYMTKSNKAMIDFEPTGNGAVNGFFVDDNHLDHAPPDDTQYASAVSISGNGSTEPNSYSSFSRNRLYNGGIQTSHLDRCTIADNIILDTRKHVNPTLHINGKADRVRVERNFLYRSSGNTQPEKPVIRLSYSGAAEGFPVDVRIQDNDVVQEHNKTPIQIEGAAGHILVRGNRVWYNGPNVVGTDNLFGLLVTSAGMTPAADITVEGNLFTGTGTTRACVQVLANTGNLGNIRFHHNDCRNSSYGLELNREESYTIASASIQGNSNYVPTLWRNVGGSAVTPVVGGNAGSIATYLVTASPEGVIAAPVGSMAINTAGGASTTLYVKTSGTGNTGWTAK